MTDENPKKPSRAEYFREYRRKHKEQLNAYQRERNAENPERKSQYNKTYWEKVKAKKLQEKESKAE